MARKKIREYDSKRLLKEHFKRISGSDLEIKYAQVTESTDFSELVNKEPWLSSTKLVVKPDMLFGKRGKSGLVALNLDLAGVAAFVKEKLGKEVEMGGCKGPITTFIVEPFVPHNEEFYLNIVSERLGCSISFSECGGIEIEENWDKVKSIFVPTGISFTSELCAPLVATLPLEIKGVIEEFIKVVYVLFLDLDFTFLEMNPFTLVDGKPYPLDMRGELDDTAAFKNFKKWGNIEFPMPFGRILSPTESFVHGLDEKTSASLKFTVLNPKGRIWTMVAGGGASVIYADTVGDLGFASELGNYAEYSGAPNEEEVLQYARVVIDVRIVPCLFSFFNPQDCATADPDGQKRALVIGGGIANFTDVAATFNGIIRALKEKESKLKAARMNLYVRRGGPNYQKGLARMRTLGEEIGIPIEVYGPEATMTVVALIAIKSDLHDPCNVMKNWYATSVDPCSWSMVTCFQDGYVSALLLQNNNITGPIPDVTGKLEKLQTLDLSDNKLFGEIPNSVGNLKNFNYLIVGIPLICGLTSQNNCSVPYPESLPSPPDAVKEQSNLGAKRHVAIDFGTSFVAVFSIIIVIGLLRWWRCRQNQQIFFDVNGTRRCNEAFQLEEYTGEGRIWYCVQGQLHDGTVVAVRRLKDYNAVGGEIQFQTEVEIALGTAQGLAYLHEQCDKPERSDAGLGICLLQPRLLLLVKRLHQEGKLNLMVDKDLENNFDGMELHEIVLAPLVCTHFNPCHRPKMSQVLRMLEGDGLAEKNGSNSSLQGSVRLRDIPITSRSPHEMLVLRKLVSNFISGSQIKVNVRVLRQKERGFVN
ncbi:ATP-citrate synthase alpha chain protein 1 [Dorcoceras hygrometricum]|nr:ATP-citrate synthase alpha chain protein 1 [Dorcoceras hygrometricum]